MAEIVGIIGSAIAIANSAATLSRALFDIVETIHNARREIADIAQQLQLLSGTLHLLWDFVHSQQHLCRPGLFHNVNAILEQYLQVDKELRELVQTPKSLARLTWYFKRTKVKSHLKRVEAVKTSLNLALNVVQLARQEYIRPLAETSATVQAKPLPNRFRKLVESAVQANRQVVESAQRQAAKDTHASSAQQRAEIDVYKEGSFDTATWLYHLVFDTHSSNTSSQSTTQSPRPFQASVVDEATENIVRFARSPAERESESRALDSEKTMIVWGWQTEPSRVVDRLLSEWTTLTEEQIELSSTPQHDEDWWKSFLKVVEEAKAEDGWDSEKWDGLFNGDGAEDLTNELTARHKKRPPFVPPDGEEAPFLRRSLSSEYGSVTSIDIPELVPLHQDDAGEPPRRDSSENKSGPGRPKVRHIRNKRHITNQKRPSQPIPSIESDKDNGSVDAFPRWNPVPLPEPSRHSHARPHEARRKATIPERYPRNPFRSNEPPFQDSARAPWYVPPNSPLPQHPPWPYLEPNVSFRPGMVHPAAPPAPEQGPMQSASAQQSKKEDELLATIKSVIEGAQKRQEVRTSEPQLDRIVHLLITQQEQQVQLEIERARVTAEVEMKSVLAARDKDDAKIQRLEKLIMQQRDEQQEANAQWQAEKTALDQKAAEQTRQAQELVERQIAAARATKKAERKTLKFAKAEAEKKAKEVADAKAKEARKKAEKKAKESIQRYESLLDRAVDTQFQPLPIREQPFRRTCIVNGNHRMEVEEYSEGSRLTPNVLTSRFLEQAASGMYNNDQSRSTQRWLGRSSTSQGTPASSILHENTSGTVDAPSEDRQMILFSPHLDQSSAKITELQSSLTEIGLDVRFADLEMDSQYERSLRGQSTDLIRSSVFWEAPMLGSGSELLNTLRACGWRPPYARSSDAGQTYFLGSQAVHSYFFRPTYTPQCSPCKVSDFSESIIIDQALIQEYALLESGFQFEVTKHGEYVLDGRLQYSDIEALIERSFAMRETYHRRTYRQLAPAPAPAPSITQHSRQSPPQYFEEPQSPASNGESDACETVSDSEADNDAQLERRSSFASTSSSVSTCLGLEPAAQSSDASLDESRTTWSGRSNNPFRKLGGAGSGSKSGSEGGRSMISMGSLDNSDVWGGALIDLS